MSQIIDVVPEVVEEKQEPVQTQDFIKALENNFVSFNPFIKAAHTARLAQMFSPKNQVQCELISDGYETKKRGFSPAKVYKDSTIWQSRSKYEPHQGKKEVARRLAQLAKAA